MTDLFLKAINMSLTAVFLILAVILLRLIFKKAPKWISCLLWAIVAIRLLVPFTLESPMSLLPTAEPVKTYAQTSEPYIESGVKVIDTAANKIISKPVPATPKKEKTTVKSTTQKTTVKRSWNAIDLLSVIWISGIAVMLIYALISYLRLRKAVFAAVKISDRVWICDEIDTPFILGIFNPRIYIPSGLNGDARKYVLEHEYAHLARFDHIWKPLSFLILAVHWFNPMCWIAYILFGRDVELACDEKAVKDMSKDDKVGYTTTLVNLSSPGKLISACPLAYAEIGVKKRVKNILNYKKPAFWLIAAAVISSVALSGCFMTNRPINTGEASGSAFETAVTDVSPLHAEMSARKKESVPEEILKLLSKDNPIRCYGNYPGAGNINKIVSLDSDITRDLIDIGAKDKIVGVDRNIGGKIVAKDDLTNDNVKVYHDAESVIKSRPDIVFITDICWRDIDTLKSSGLCVVEIPKYKSLYHMAEHFRFLGALTGKTENAEGIAKEIETTLSQLKAFGESIKEEDKKTLSFVKDYEGESWMIENDKIYQEIADLIGVKYSSPTVYYMDDNKFEKHMTETDPDIIFYELMTFHGSVDKLIMSNDNLKDIKAVKNYDLYYLGQISDSDIYWGIHSRYDVFNLITFIQMKTYPELFPDA